MQYLGGKSRIANHITEVILNEVYGRQIKNLQQDSRKHYAVYKRGGGTLISLFCGTCSVESRLAKYFDTVVCNDNHKYLIEMLKGVQHGYKLPDVITEEQYKYIRDHKDEDPILSGFVGFGCSFAGKWFSSYARSKKGTNYCAQSKRSLLKDMANLSNAKFICKDYRDVTIPENSVIYADPPYRNTSGYGKEKFDSDAFWDYAREVSSKNLIFISEQQSPNDFISIWERPIVRTIRTSNYFTVIEKLYIHKNNLYKPFS